MSSGTTEWRTDPPPLGVHVWGTWAESWGTHSPRAELCCKKCDWWYTVREWKPLKNPPTHWAHVTPPKP
jgi:hypothetical protein